MEYLVTPQAYLARARERLLSDDPKDIFYAALELRCCVEARQADYLEALETYEGRRPKPWRVGELARKLLHAWNDPKIARLTYTIGESEFPTFYTPVRPELSRAVEKELGRLLHSQTSARIQDAEWWPKTKDRLKEIYREAWISCRGEHAAPPLWKAKTREVHPVRLYLTPASEELIAALMECATSKEQFWVEVQYLEEPPADWQCDL